MNDEELDAWIGETLFDLDLTGDRRHYVDSMFSFGRSPMLTPVPDYTSDMNEAIKVMEKLSSTLSLKYFAASEEWELQKGTTRFEQHENPAMAICLAFYKLETGENWNERDQYI